MKRRGSTSATVGYEASDVQPDADFALYFAPEKDEIGVNLLTYKPGDEDGYFMLLASPGVDVKEKQVILKDVAFVLDTSGSMAGAKLEQAKKALKFCVENLNGGDRNTGDRLIPYCVFTDPPLGRVGINESQARANNIAYRLASLPMEAVLRTRTLSETRGFMKVIIDAQSDRILGFAAFGPEAGELMSNVQVAMLARQPYTLLRDAVFTHPTMTEGLVPLFSRVPKRLNADLEKR